MNRAEAIELLEEGIDFSENEGQDPDEISWRHFLGVLITANQAKAIVELLKGKSGE